jgi:hypothetical protein
MGFLCFVSSGSGPSHFRSQIHQPETLSDFINFVSFGHLFCLDLDLAILLHQDVHLAQTELYQMNLLDGIPNRPSGELGRPARQQPASQYPWDRPDAHSGVRHRTTPPTSPSELLGASPSRTCQVAYEIVRHWTSSRGAPLDHRAKPSLGANRTYQVAANLGRRLVSSRGAPLDHRARPSLGANRTYQVAADLGRRLVSSRGAPLDHRARPWE